MGLGGAGDMPARRVKSAPSSPQTKNTKRTRFGLLPAFRTYMGVQRLRPAERGGGPGSCAVARSRPGGSNSASFGLGTSGFLCSGWGQEWGRLVFVGDRKS